MPDLRFVSPERRWRAAAAVLLTAWFGWKAYDYAGPAHYLALVTAGLLSAGLLGCVVPIIRSCLIVTDEGLIDRRGLRTVRVPWQQIAEFRVERPGRLWGGFCVVAARRDETHVDLLSTRAYSLLPSSHHLDELQRISWILEERLAKLKD